MPRCYGRLTGVAYRVAEAKLTLLYTRGMESYDGRPFNGVKAALYYQGKLLVYQRDDKPGLRFADLWDFFGGGREDNETPFECLKREIQEELEITVNQTQVVFVKSFPAMHDPAQSAYFMVVRLAREDMDHMRFGSEGQGWKLVTVEDFLGDGTVIPYLKSRLQSYLESIS